MFTSIGQGQLAHGNFYIAGLVVAMLACPRPGACEPAAGHRDDTRQVLSSAAAMPLRMESQRLGPHPSDPSYAQFRAQLDAIADQERARNQAATDGLQRIQSLE